MQLTLEAKYATYYPPKSQLLKWIGNKQKFAAEITQYFPSSFKRYFEPFLGSGAILATLAPKDGLGSDIFAPLIEIWTTLKDNPARLVEWYSTHREKLQHLPKEKVYDSVRASYNSSPNGADFLFLSRTCYGGVVRFRKKDGFMSTPCGIHDPISTEAFSKRVKEWHMRLRNVSFRHCDYKEAFSEARAGDLIYCDPPYTHSQSILYGAQSFQLAELMSEIDKARSKGVRVALSIDGSKKSGNQDCPIEIPSGLFEQEVYVECGRSMLKRFQMEGKQLKSEDVADRLLLTYPL